MQKAHRRWLYISTIVWLLAPVAPTIVDSTEASQSGLPTMIPIAADGLQRTTVTLGSYSDTPKHLIVEAEKPVELTLTSVTTMIPHNFIIKDSAGSLSLEQDARAGDTVTITFTATQPGTFTIYCDKRLWPLPSHRDKGMEGKLEVR